MTLSDPFKYFVPWEPSFFVVAITLMGAVIYVRGSFIRRPSLASQFGFWSGLFSLYVVSHTAFDYYAEHEFFMHRIQHVVLHHLGPFLIALSRPGSVLSAGMPVSWSKAARRFLDQTIVAKFVDTLNRPLVAVSIFCGLIIFWLVPPIHFVAMLDVRYYRLMNWGMAANGLMFWNLVLNNFALRDGHIDAGSRIGMMLAAIPVQIVAGVLIFIAPKELYPIYSLCGRAYAGVGALLDQQIGGAILWVQGAMMSIIGALIVLHREWLKRK